MPFSLAPTGFSEWCTEDVEATYLDSAVEGPLLALFRLVTEAKPNDFRDWELYGVEQPG
jgi:hypothetical protein